MLDPQKVANKIQDVTIETLDALLYEMTEDVHHDQLQPYLHDIKAKLSLTDADLDVRLREVRGMADISVVLRDCCLPASGLINKSFPPVKSYVENLINEYTGGLIWSKPGAGKTLLALSLIRCNQAGLALGSWQGITPTKTLYVDGELPISDIQERLPLIIPEVHDLNDFSYFSCCYAERYGWPSMNLASGYSRKALTDFILRHGYKLVFLDNVVSLIIGIDGNSQDEWSQINRWFLSLRAHGVAVIVLDHSTKDEKSFRGTGNKIDNMSLSLKLTRDNKCFTHDRVTVTFDKGRLAPELKRPFIVNFKRKPSGVYYWETEDIRESGNSIIKKKEIVKRRAEGQSVASIIAEGVCVKSYAYDVINKAIADDYLTDKCKLTMKGKKWLGCNEDDE